MPTIKFNKEVCIGCGTCAAVCPDNWELVGDKAKPKDLNPKEMGCNKEAEQNCPTGAIKML